MLARALIAAIAAVMAVAGPARAQPCLAAPNRTCVLQQALAAAQAIKDDGARAQALSQIATIEADAGRVDEALTLAHSITDALWRDSTLGDIATAQAKAGRIAPALQAAEPIEDGDRRAQALGVIAAAQAKAGNLDEAG